MTLISKYSMQNKHRLMPNRTTYSVQSQTSIGVYATGVSVNGWYRDLADQEKAASDGVYVQFERNFFLPQVYLPNQPQPGDLIVDGANTYTVLSMGVAGGLGTWKVRAVDLVIAANLCDTIDIQRPDISFNGSGASVRSWPPAAGQTVYQEINCRIQELHGDIAEERGLRGFRKVADIFLSQQVLLKPDDRISVVESPNFDALQTWLILGYRSGQRIDELPTLSAAIPP